MRTALLVVALIAGLLNCVYSAPQPRAATLQEIQNILMQDEATEEPTEEATETQYLCNVLSDRTVDTGNGARSQWLHIHFHHHWASQQDQAEQLRLSCTPVNVGSNGQIQLLKFK